MAYLKLILVTGLLMVGVFAWYYPPPPPPEGRTISGQWDATVAISAQCGDGLHWYTGSGVIVSDDVVLTARHVVADHYQDNGAWVNCPNLQITVREIDGTMHDATVEAEASSDIARLRIVEKFTDPPAVLGPRPLLGENVCMVALRPEPWRRCGETQPTTDSLIRVNFQVVHGNSGAGVYDTDGRLIGIIVTLDPNAMGGEASVIDDPSSRFLFPTSPP